MTRTTSLPTIEELRAQSPLLVSAFDNLVRGDIGDLKGCLVEHKRDITVRNTNAIAHIYHLALDGNGRVLTKILAERIASSIVEYAIPRSLAIEAHERVISQKSTSDIFRLIERARTLFVDLDKTGEGGEMFLWALTEQLLGIPQVLSKMSLKTSGAVHFHGSDGVHANVNDATRKLELYFCESKMYSDLVSGLDKCFQSAAPFLLNMPTLGTEANHEMFLATEFNKIGDPQLAEALIDHLTPGSIAAQSTEFCLSTFVGFDSEVYPPNVDVVLDEISDAVRAKVNDWVSSCGQSISKHKIHDFKIIVFLIPFDSVQVFRDQFMISIGVKKDD